MDLLKTLGISHLFNAPEDPMETVKRVNRQVVDFQLCMRVLATAIEQAETGSEHLDQEIARCCGITWSADEDGQFGGYGRRPRRVQFTRSVDAAMTLEFEFRPWSLRSINKPNKTAIARIGGKTEMRIIEAEGATPALALAAAWLRART